MDAKHLKPVNRPAGRKTTIYIASRAVHGPRWRKLRDEGGAPIISTWIDECGQGETNDWSDLWDRCIREAAAAIATIVYVETGEVLKGALVEAGAALAAGRMVFVVGPCAMTFLNHPRVQKSFSVADAIEAAAKLEEIG